MVKNEYHLLLVKGIYAFLSSQSTAAVTLNIISIQTVIFLENLGIGKKKRRRKNTPAFGLLLGF